MAAQMQVEFSHITIETDTSKIDEMVNAVKNKKLYPSFKENVEVEINSEVLNIKNFFKIVNAVLPFGNGRSNKNINNGGIQKNITFNLY